MFGHASGEDRQGEDEDEGGRSSTDFDASVVQLGDDPVSCHGLTVSQAPPTGDYMREFAPSGCRLCSNADHV